MTSAPYGNASRKHPERERLPTIIFDRVMQIRQPQGRLRRPFCWRWGGVIAAVKAWHGIQSVAIFLPPTVRLIVSRLEKALTSASRIVHMTSSGPAPGGFGRPEGAGLVGKESIRVCSKTPMPAQWRVIGAWRSNALPPI